MSWENIGAEDRTDFRDLQTELLTLLDEEETKRNRFLSDLTTAFEDANVLSDVERTIYGRTYDGIERASNQLDSEFRDLRREVRIKPESRAKLVHRFTYSGIRIVPAIRRSAYLRTVLTRHTPTLRGRPVSPHPRQYPIRSGSDSITVDYLRAACVFERDGQSGEAKRKPHPIIDGHAEDVSDILFETQPDISLSFS